MKDGFKKKYYVWRVNGIVRRLHKKANKAAAQRDITPYKLPLYRSRVPEFLSGKDTGTWYLALKAQWMLKHNAPNENDVTGLDFDPKKAPYLPGEESNESKDARRANIDKPYEPRILVTFVNADGGPADMNNPAGTVALFNGSPEHPVYGSPETRKKMTGLDVINAEKKHNGQG